VNQIDKREIRISVEDNTLFSFTVFIRDSLPVSAPILISVPAMGVSAKYYNQLVQSGQVQLKAHHSCMTIAATALRKKLREYALSLNLNFSGTIGPPSSGTSTFQDPY